jgi:intracellular sulfur oxidation DsrE/DsrF family protein
MKRKIFTLCLLFFATCFAGAQTHDYNVVFDLTSKDTVDHKAVIRWLSEISKSTPAANLEVVFYGQSLDMVVKNKSVVADDVARFAAMKNISFKVCAIAMKNHHISEAELLPGVVIVPDGIYEIITKQKEGWGYIKATR